MTKKSKSFPARTWREYTLQLSVVIIGIVVTFAGSGLIERWRVAREVRATMLLVHAELETNRADFMQVWDYQQWEMRACKFLTDNRRDLKRIPSDTLASFDPVYGRIHFFHPRRDAFEVLKNSGLMSSVPDKDFLLAVTQGYAVLADLEENISMYYQLKLTAQNDMSKDFSEKQRERFYTGDMYERWECIFSVPCFAEFMLTAPYFFRRDISKDCWRTSIGRYGRSKRNTNWIKNRPMIKVTDIHKRFGDLEVLKGVSLDVARGEVVSIVGASGAGKTTLLQIVGTLSRPDGGRVEIDGQDVFRWAIRRCPDSATDASVSCSSSTTCCPSSRPSRTSASRG